MGYAKLILFRRFSARFSTGFTAGGFSARIAAAGIAAAALTGIAAGAVGIFMSAIALTAMVGVAGALRTFVTAAVGGVVVVGWCCNCWSSVVVAITNGSVCGFPVANT